MHAISSVRRRLPNVVRAFLDFPGQLLFESCTGLCSGVALSANLSKSRSARRQKAQSKHEDNQTAGTEEIAALRESFITCLETAHAILDFEGKETRDAAKALQDFLQDFSKKRNKIAHAGGSSIVVLESDFSALVNVFRIIARSLATLVEAEIEKAIRQGRV